LHTPILLKPITHVLAFILSLLFSAHVLSADIFYEEDRPFSQLHIKGDIVKGDYQKILSLIKKNGDIPYQISLDSKGGNVMEALKIGTFTRKYLLRAETKKCNSACVFILIASLFKNENKHAEYGVHRPKFNAKYFASLNMQEASAKYKKLYAIVANYMYSMGASKQLVDNMFSVPSGSMKFLRNRQFYSMVTTSTQAYSEWIIAKCGDDLNAQEQQQLTEFHQNRSLLSKSYFAYLDSKSTEYFNCELESVRNEQMRIFSADARFQSSQMSLN
jgi:hypothetical protein